MKQRKKLLEKKKHDVRQFGMMEQYHHMCRCMHCNLHRHKNAL